MANLKMNPSLTLLSKPFTRFSKNSPLSAAEAISFENPDFRIIFAKKKTKTIQPKLTSVCSLNSLDRINGQPQNLMRLL